MTTGLRGPTGDELILRVYPNPSSGQAYLLVEAPVQEAYYWEVFNSLGQRVDTGEGRAGAILPLALSYYPAGVYWVSVQAGRYRGAVKVVRE